MGYSFLGQDLWETATFAKKHFTANYGASRFKCEEAINPSLPLRPTWQARLRNGYSLCVETRATPFSATLYEFVTVCAQNSSPIKLWVAVPSGTPSGFADELRRAREAGIGVVQFQVDGQAHEFHRATALSLFGLKKSDLASIPKCRRDFIRNAEATFLEGSPGPGCQELCQELEKVTRDFARTTYDTGLWKSKPTLNFRTAQWARVLRELENNVKERQVQSAAPAFRMNHVVEARGYTDWRNSVSHAPNTYDALRKRDAKLRTMFEATRNLLVEWWAVGRQFKIVK